MRYPNKLVCMVVAVLMVASTTAQAQCYFDSSGRLLGCSPGYRNSAPNSIYSKTIPATATYRTATPVRTFWQNRRNLRRAAINARVTSRRATYQSSFATVSSTPSRGSSGGSGYETYRVAYEAPSAPSRGSSGGSAVVPVPIYEETSSELESTARTSPSSGIKALVTAEVDKQLKEVHNRLDELAKTRCKCNDGLAYVPAFLSESRSLSGQLVVPKSLVANDSSSIIVAMN